MQCLKTLLLSLICFSNSSYAKELIIISHPFPPWQFEQNHVVQGINLFA